MQTARWLTIGLLTHDLGGTILLQRGGEHLHPYAVRLGLGLGLGLGTWTWTCEMRCTCACGALRGEHLGCRGGASVHEDVRRPPRVRVPPRLEGEHRRCRRGRRERCARCEGGRGTRRCCSGGADCEGRIARGAWGTRGRAGARGAKWEAHGVAPPVLGEGRRFDGPLVRAARNTQGLPVRSTVETTVTSAGRKSFAMATPEGKWPPKLPRRSMSSSSADASGSAASTRSTDS